MAPKSASLDKLGFNTRSVHGDAGYVQGQEVAPNISVSTTFRHPTPEQVKAAGEVEFDPSEPTRDIYSRYTQPTLTRVEKVLGSLIGAPTILYPSGIAAFYGVLLLYRPDVIAITDGYHGCHESLQVYRQTRGADAVRVIKLDDPYPTEGKLLCWVETPLNPTGECRSIEFYAKKAHVVGGTVGVDSTFGPPPLQDPFKWGADVVMHSGTKYFGGQSDALTGTVSVKNKEDWLALWHNRTYTGSTPGSLEAWLILRSLRTLNLRVTRQSATATALAQWLSSLTRGIPGSELDGPSDVIEQVWHATLQDGGGGQWVGEGKQMESGPACFAILLAKEVYAEQLGHVLELFTPATSLGGVESLIEQRSVSDPGADPRLVRLSIGLEDFEDLKADLIHGLRKVVQMEKGVISKL